MRHHLHRRATISAYALALASLPLAGLSSPATSAADDGCGAGMYFNWETNLCEYYDVNVVVDPCCNYPAPAINGIGGPAGPGGPGGPAGPGGPGGPGGPLLPGRR